MDQLVKSRDGKCMPLGLQCSVNVALQLISSPCCFSCLVCLGGLTVSLFSRQYE